MMRLHVALYVVIVCLGVAIIGGCASHRHGTEAFVGPDLPFRTPGPRELESTVRVAQLITAKYGSETYVFEAQLSVSPDQLTLMCIDPLGRRALTIVSTGEEVTTDAAPWLPKGLRAENILADIALVYWPADAIRRGFLGTRAIVAVNAHKRTITLDDREIVSVEYEPQDGQAWPSSASYRNHAFGYELVLRSAVVPQ